MDDIIVGVDQSETASQAAITAAKLASAYGTNLHVVMCVKPGRSTEGGVGSDTFVSDPESDAQIFLGKLGHELPHDQITTAALHGDPASVMCDEASRLGAKIIVVGNRRVQGITRVLGSIASDVAKHAPCDILIANTSG